MFDNPSAYHRVKSANLLTNEVIQRLYRVTDEEILTHMYFEHALTWKCTIKRSWAQGSLYHLLKKIGILAQTSIALSALAAAQIYAIRNQVPVPRAEVPLKHTRLNGKPDPSPWGLIGGLQTLDRYVRIHDSFPNHAEGALEPLGLPKSASRQQVSQENTQWASADLEAHYHNPHAISNFPILLKKLANGCPSLSTHLPEGSGKCSRALRVLELSRVIAAPPAGKTLAAHGADALWLDIDKSKDLAQLQQLITSADVFIREFLPGCLTSRDLSAEEIFKINLGIIIVNMFAFGPIGVWSNRRGFDSLVAHFGVGEIARPLPCEILGHVGEYLLLEGGACQVDISLASIMKYLRSLGQYPVSCGFQCNDYEYSEDVEEDRGACESDFGLLGAMRHSVVIDGCSVGWEIMPKPSRSDEPIWLQ
ncbi:CoA-transferase family III [Trichoderma pleuroticola]